MVSPKVHSRSRGQGRINKFPLCPATIFNSRGFIARREEGTEAQRVIGGAALPDLWEGLPAPPSSHLLFPGPGPRLLLLVYLPSSPDKTEAQMTFATGQRHSHGALQIVGHSHARRQGPASAQLNSFIPCLPRMPTAS